MVTTRGRKRSLEEKEPDENNEVGGEDEEEEEIDGGDDAEKNESDEDNDSVERPQEEEHDDDDDEAPEEISLATGKKEVERLEKNRIVAQEIAAKALEEKKKRRNQVRKEQKEEAQKLRYQAEKAAEELDLLPDDVLAALAEREASDHRLVERRVVTEQLRNVSSTSKRKKKFVDQRDIAGFTVQVSKAEPYRKPSASARAFLEQRLHDRVKRSNDMLRPPRGLTRPNI